jgi:Tfp pilus assembly pilus retraction ATPase PilT
MIYTLAALLEILVVERADALHLHPGEKPVVESARTLWEISGPRIEPADIDALLRQIASKEQFREFHSLRVVSCYHHVPGQGWFAVLAFREQSQTRLEIRAVR